MKILFCFFSLVPFFCIAQDKSFNEQILHFRQKYIQDLLEEKRHPISESDVRYIKFFEPDIKYCVLADVTLTQASSPVLFQTHSGKSKPFKEYACLVFELNDVSLKLHAYHSVDLISAQANNQELFIPFNDLTNYESTYGGGRYLDISVSDIESGKVLLDFNKCYNPYCAYADGFSCPVPPAENRLPIEIKAGEMQYQKFIR